MFFCHVSGGRYNKRFCAIRSYDRNCFLTDTDDVLSMTIVTCIFLSAVYTVVVCSTVELSFITILLVLLSSPSRRREY